jgi:ethanolamine utilization protein EutQ (cupin superfamily)
MKSIDERIVEIEKLFPYADGIHGTTITRILTQDRGQIWSIGFGAMYQPKRFFEGLTIEEALYNAEKEYFN